MKDLAVEVSNDKIIVGKAPEPVLIIDLKKQENRIIAEGLEIPYHKKVMLSPDLLCGKRHGVFLTALEYYYAHACGVARDMKIAAEYRERMDIVER
ncbi:hypothetical protein NXH76_17805 [Blautia schinkii]|nr:hypothetical protein [Blautia schinkii]